MNAAHEQLCDEIMTEIIFLQAKYELEYYKGRDLKPVASKILRDLNTKNEKRRGK